MNAAAGYVGNGTKLPLEGDAVAARIERWATIASAVLDPRVETGAGPAWREQIPADHTGVTGGTRGVPGGTEEEPPQQLENCGVGAPGRSASMSP